MDDNEEIIELINERMSFGADKYGHGVQVDDSSIDWETMMMEEPCNAKETEMKC